MRWLVVIKPTAEIACARFIGALLASREEGLSVRYMRLLVLRTLATFAAVALLVQQPGRAQIAQGGNELDRRRITFTATTQSAVIESNALIARMLQVGELTRVRVHDDPQIASRQIQTLQ